MTARSVIAANRDDRERTWAYLDPRSVMAFSWDQVVPYDHQEPTSYTFQDWLYIQWCLFHIPRPDS